MDFIKRTRGEITEVILCKEDYNYQLKAIEIRVDDKDYLLNNVEEYKFTGCCKLYGVPWQVEKEYKAVIDDYLSQNPNVIPLNLGEVNEKFDELANDEFTRKTFVEMIMDTIKNCEPIYQEGYEMHVNNSLDCFKNRCFHLLKNYKHLAITKDNYMKDLLECIGCEIPREYIERYNEHLSYYISLYGLDKDSGKYSSWGTRTNISALEEVNYSELIKMYLEGKAYYNWNPNIKPMFEHYHFRALEIIDEVNRYYEETNKVMDFIEKGKSFNVTLIDGTTLKVKKEEFKQDINHIIVKSDKHIPLKEIQNIKYGKEVLEF